MPERKTLNRTYSVGDQVPTCPVFTRAKIKSRFEDFSPISRHNLLYQIILYKKGLYSQKSVDKDFFFLKHFGFVRPILEE